MNKNNTINIAKYLDKFCEVVMDNDEKFSGRLLEKYSNELYFITGGPTVIKVILLDSIKSIKIVDAPKSFIY